MASAIELSAMRRAIALSAMGLGTTSPNPPVGCVILDATGQVVGEGYHRRKGESHAEVNALTAAGERTAGGTAVVTLEPCNHYGRTPPCHQALLDAGIARTVVAVIDPTSRGEGGVARLRQAGMDVEVGVLADEARLVLGLWLAALDTARPFVVWPYLITSTGAIESVVGHSETADQLVSVDAMLHDDGRVTEAVPGSHGVGVLDLAAVSLAAGPQATLSALHSGGVRSLALRGGLSLAAPFLAEGLVDRVIAHLPMQTASVQPTLAGDSDLLLLPPEFRIVQIEKCGQYVCVVAQQA